MILLSFVIIFLRFLSCNDFVFFYDDYRFSLSFCDIFYLRYYATSHYMPLITIAGQLSFSFSLIDTQPAFSFHDYAIISHSIIT